MQHTILFHVCSISFSQKKNTQYNSLNYSRVKINELFVVCLMQKEKKVKKNTLKS